MTDKVKLYAVKNDEGQYYDFHNQDGFWPLSAVPYPATFKKKFAKETATTFGGHVVKLVEEPKKVVLSKEEAKIVEDAHDDKYPANYISGKTDGEKLLMEAFVNGYTVAKEKKYNVKVPYAAGWHFQKYSSASKLGARNNWRPFPAKDIDSNMSKELFQFTEAEIDHYGLQYCEKEEVTDDEL